MDNLRWDSYVLIPNDKIDGFWESHFGIQHASRKTLFILGKGFDVRMNYVLNSFLRSCPNCQLECLLVEYFEGNNSPSLKYESSVCANMQQIVDLLKLSNKKTYESLVINLFNESRRIGDRDISSKIFNYDISPYSDIIVDISSLPRGIYFSLIGTLLKKIDLDESLKGKNLFVTVAENTQIDRRINEEGLDERIKWIHGFGGKLEIESTQKPLIFFPLLGEKRINDLKKIYTHLNPQEMCPILPFPSKDPRRADSLIIDYHKVLFDELRTERQNIMYVHEQNPFEVYRTLSNAITNYNKSLEVLGGCNVAITAFSSKLLTIGVLLTAYEKGEGTGVYNLDSQGYSIENNDIDILNNLNSHNEIFLMWLNGEAYER